MSGGLIQLVAYGIQDMFLTGDPQITFFKTTYRRHTNFTIEPVAQYFNKTSVKLGDTVYCNMSRTGDMVYRVYLVVTLPPIPQFTANGLRDSRTKFSWIRKLGFAMIKKVSFDLGGQIIDSQTGEWMNIWHELTHPDNNNSRRMIGDVPEVTDWSNGKSPYTLHVPLFFWFCKDNVLALPLVALQYSQARIAVEFQPPEKCYNISPTHSIQLLDDTVQYKPYEYIEQTIDGNLTQGIFVDFDPITRTMWYIKITDTPFVAMQTTSIGDDRVRRRYAIHGISSRYTAYPLDNAVTRQVKRKITPNIIFSDCHLDVEYVYLDVDERARLLQTAHQQLIEQVQIGSSKLLQSNNTAVKLSLNHPCKALFWIVQLKGSANLNDRFNYTTSPYRDRSGALIGKNLVVEAELVLNGQSRTGTKGGGYFNWLQPYLYYAASPSEGINAYAMGILPMKWMPSGSANMSKIDDIELRLKIDPRVNIAQTGTLQVYALSYNVLRSINGLGGVLFSN
jgi:hypothetical protein